MVVIENLRNVTLPYILIKGYILVDFCKALYNVGLKLITRTKKIIKKTILFIY